MNIVERTNLLMDLLEKRDFMMVDEIAELTQVSKATIRRDLQELEEKGIVKRFRGGVSLKDKVLREESVPLHEMLVVNTDNKIKIARKAAELIEDGDVIFLDSGSTTYQMIPFIHAEDVHVVTNGVKHAAQLSDMRIPTYILGGSIALDGMLTLGEEITAVVEKMNFDKAFLGARGVDQQAGYTTTNENDSAMKAAAVRRAVKSYVLADSGKIGKRKFFTFASMKEAVCITNDCEEAGLLEGEVLLAD